MHINLSVVLRLGFKGPILENCMQEGKKISYLDRKPMKKSYSFLLQSSGMMMGRTFILVSLHLIFYFKASKCNYKLDKKL